MTQGFPGEAFDTFKLLLRRDQFYLPTCLKASVFVLSLSVHYKYLMIIFYADDDADELSLFRDTIRSIDPDIEFITATNGEQALQVLNDTTPDLIFLDVHMPRLTGPECLKVIREHDELKAVPVIMYSSDTERSSIRQCAKLGATDFLNKSANIIQLQEQLRSILSSHGFPMKTVE